MRLTGIGTESASTTLYHLLTYMRRQVYSVMQPSCRLLIISQVWKTPPNASDSYPATNAGDSKTVRVPRELEGGLTRAVLEMAEPGIALPMVGFLFAIFIVLTYRTHSPWVYFIPPPLGSLLASLTFILEPFNPYRNLYARLEGRKLEDCQNDPNAQRLLSLLGSQKARNVLVRTGFLLAISLCLLMLLVTLLQPAPFNSTLVPVDLVFNTFGFWIAALSINVHFLLSWAFREWHRAA